MNIIYDAQKDFANRQKHGLSLADAHNIDWLTCWERVDQDLAYGEDRMIGLAIMGVRLYCVVYTDRGDIRRIISLRKATQAEVKLYAANN